MKVLFPIEEPRTAHQIVDFVREHQWQKDVEIRLLAVVQPVELVAPLAPLPVFSEDAYEQMNKSAEELLRKTAAELRKDGYEKVQSETMLGDPAHSILSEVDEWKPDLVVVGKHVKSGFERFIMGSVSEQVAANASCSVLVLKLPVESAKT